MYMGEDEHGSSSSHEWVQPRDVTAGKGQQDSVRDKERTFRGFGH